MFPPAPAMNAEHTEGGVPYHWDGKWERGFAPATVDGGGQIGAMTMWPNDVAPPHFLFCDGSTFVQATYPLLYIALGNTTRLPNTVRRFLKFDPVGVPNTPFSHIAGFPASGRLTATLDGNVSDAGRHRHIVSSHSHIVGWTMSDSDGHYAYRGNNPDLDHGPYTYAVYSNYLAAHHHDYTAAVTLTGGDFEMRPDNIALMFIIRASNP